MQTEKVGNRGPRDPLQGRRSRTEQKLESELGETLSSLPRCPLLQRRASGLLTSCVLTLCANAMALAHRGTGCVNCARPDLWGAWLGNRWAYPERFSFYLSCRVEEGRNLVPGQCECGSVRQKEKAARISQLKVSNCSELTSQLPTVNPSPADLEKGRFTRRSTGNVN